MGMEEVAPGDGALRQCKIRPLVSNTKSPTGIRNKLYSYGEKFDSCNKSNNKNHPTLAHFFATTKCSLVLLFIRNILFNNPTSIPWT